MENILPEDTLETGFRVKVNQAIDEIINANPTIDNNGDIVFPKHGGTSWLLTLSDAYYKKTEVVEVLNTKTGYSTETTSGIVKRASLNEALQGQDSYKYTTPASVKSMIENSSSFVDLYRFGDNLFELGSVNLLKEGANTVGVQVVDTNGDNQGGLVQSATGWSLSDGSFSANLDLSALTSNINIDLSKVLNTSENAWLIGGNTLPSGQKLGSLNNFDVDFVANNSVKMSLISNGGIIFRTDGVFESDLTVENTLSVLNIAAETTDTDKFLVSNAGLIKYRTGTQLLGDIGAASGTGTTNYLTKWSNATGGLTNSLLFDNGNGVGIGTTSLTGVNLSVSKNITGAVNSQNILSQGTVQSGVTNSARYFSAISSTQATAFTLPNLVLYEAAQGNIGAGSTVNSQFGFWARESLIGATNNYGFRGQIPSGTNRWNLYMDGTANNYINGSLGIGTTSLTGVNLSVSKNITGSIQTFGIINNGTIQSDVTTASIGVLNTLNTQATTFTLPSYTHFRANQGTIGAGSVVSNQTGYLVTSNMIGATNNYGFQGSIPSGTNRWNLYMDGTAQNHFRGFVGIGASRTVPTTELDVNGTIKTTAFQLTTGAGAGKILQSDANGVASWVNLNTSGYLGTWNASTNTPTIANGTGTAGQWYIVTTGGTWNSITFSSGDQVYYNGTTWQRVPSSFTLPTATDSILGGIKIGVGLQIDGSGVASVAYGTTSTTAAVGNHTHAFSNLTSTPTTIGGYGITDYNSLWDTQLATKTTTNLTEGSNLYYTEARVNANSNVALNTASRHDAVTLGTANGLSLSTQVLSLALASTSTTGALSSTDWNTFNGKQNALSGTGFVKISGTTISYDNSTYLTSFTETDPIFVAFRDASRTANTFYAAPNGTAGAGVFRAIVASDIPTLNQNTTGSAATLTTSRNIAITGDIAWNVNFNGSANATAVGTLATVNANIGTFNNVTVNAKGLVTAASNVSYLTANQTISITGDATGSGTTSIPLTLANVATAGTYRSVTINSKGLVTSGTNPTTISGYGITDFYSQVVSGFVTGANSTVLNTDSLEVALEKLQGQINARLSGNQTITLSGIITGSGTTSITTAIADNALSIAKTSGLQSALDAKQATLSGTGFMSANGTTISYSKNINLENTTFANQNGVIQKNGVPFLHDFSYGLYGSVTSIGQNIFLGSANFVAGKFATQTWHGSYNVAVGGSALLSNTTGAYNVSMGHNSAYTNLDGNYNVAIGFSALYNNLSGYSNIAIGGESLYNNTSYQNIGIGFRSLYANASGIRNIAIGISSLVANTTGSYNIGIGHEALIANTTGIYNLSIGHLSLYSNTTGAYNLGLGITTLRSNTTGSYNIGMGQDALTGNTTGSSNTAIGISALRANLVGSFNVAVGRSALFVSNSNSNNTALGYRAGVNHVTGNSNTFLGHEAGLGITTGSNNIIIGANITGLPTTLNDHIIIGVQGGLRRFVINDLGFAGLGVDSPAYKLEIGGNAKVRAELYVEGFASIGATNPLTIESKTYALLGTPTAYYNEISSVNQYLRINTDSGFALRHNSIDAISFQNGSWKFNTPFTVTNGEESQDWTGFDIDDRFRIGINEVTGRASFEMVYQNSIIVNSFNDDGILCHIDNQGTQRKYLREGDIITGGGTTAITPTLQQVSEQGASSSIRLQFNGTNYATMSDLGFTQNLDSVLGNGNLANNKSIRLNQTVGSTIKPSLEFAYNNTTYFNMQPITNDNFGVAISTEGFNINTSSFNVQSSNSVSINAESHLILWSGSTNGYIELRAASNNGVAYAGGSAIVIGQQNFYDNMTAIGKFNTTDYIKLNGDKYNFKLPTIANGEYLVFQKTANGVIPIKATIFASGGRNYLTI